MMIGWLVLWACARGVREIPPASVTPAPGAPIGQALAPVTGLRVDSAAGFSVDIPQEWAALSGEGALRLRAVDAQTGARVEIWSFAGTADDPMPRAECQWNFVDEAAYRRLGHTGSPLRVATCTPHDPAGPYVFSSIVRMRSSALHVEVVVPGDRFLEARSRGEAFVARIQLDAVSGAGASPLPSEAATRGP